MNLKCSRIRFIALLTVLIVVLNITSLVQTKPVPGANKELSTRHREERSIFGLASFMVGFLNAILAISLNTSINRQNAMFGSIQGG